MLETLLQPNDIDERCGFVLDDGSIVEIANVSETPAASFKMDPVQVLEHLDRVKETWHTHPDTDPNLSGEDHSGFLAWPDMVHSIIGRRGGEVVVTRWRVEEGLVIGCD